MVSDIPPSHYEYKIPDQDRSGVEAYLKCVLFNDHFSFVLFGAKAMAMTAYNEDAYTENFFHWPYRTSEDYFFKIFEKSKDLFCSDSFFIKTDNNYGPYHRIICVNSKKFLQVVDQHKDRFSQILGSNISGEKLLDKIKNSNEDVLSILGHSDELFGILLGFGQKNSYAHVQRCIKENNFSECSKPPLKLRYHCPFGKDPYERCNFYPMEEEENFWPWMCTQENAMDRIKNIEFCGFDEEETREIAVKFDKSRKIIAPYFKDKDIIDATLKQIHRKKPIVIE